MGPPSHSMLFHNPVRAAARIALSSCRRNSRIRSSYASSHAYNLMALIPKMTSLDSFTRSSVNLTMRFRI